MSQGEDEAEEDSKVEMEVGGVSRETHSQWSNVTLAERIAWRPRRLHVVTHRLDAVAGGGDERQEEILWDQARSLACMADAMEKTVGGATKFVDAMELFVRGDRYLRTWEMGWSGNEQEEAPLKSAWKDRSKRAESGNGSGAGSGSGVGSGSGAGSGAGSGSVDAEATLQ